MNKKTSMGIMVALFLLFGALGVQGQLSGDPNDYQYNGTSIQIVGIPPFNSSLGTSLSFSGTIDEDGRYFYAGYYDNGDPVHNVIAKWDVSTGTFTGTNISTYRVGERVGGLAFYNGLLYGTTVVPTDYNQGDLLVSFNVTTGASSLIHNLSDDYACSPASTCLASALAIGDGNLYTMIRVNDSIQKYDFPSMNIVSSTPLTVSGDAGGLEYVNGFIYYAESSTGDITEFNATTLTATGNYINTTASDIIRGISYHQNSDTVGTFWISQYQAFVDAYTGTPLIPAVAPPEEPPAEEEPGALEITGNAIGNASGGIVTIAVVIVLIAGFVGSAGLGTYLKSKNKRRRG